eukprot:3137457-Rhodomonas_salina.2
MQPMRALRDVRYSRALCRYRLESSWLSPRLEGGQWSSRTVKSAIGLRAQYAKSGTDIPDGFDVKSAIGLRAPYAASGTDMPYSHAIGLRACYAMSGTGTQYGSGVTSGTDMPFGFDVKAAIGLCALYAMSGTDTAYRRDVFHAV